MSDSATYANIIRRIASELGFSHCGISKAGFLESEAPKLENWLRSGFHGSMSYMNNHFDKRLNPQLLVPGTRSVISLMMNYYAPAMSRGEAGYRIARYAYGQDYHDVIRSKLNHMLELMREQIGAIEGRGFTDSAPVLARAWAVRAGLGWIGKNTNLITRRNGSYFFLAELLIDLELDPDPPFSTHHCGTCTACIDACPTDAIAVKGGVDGSKCISYFTIELKEEIPQMVKGKFDNWIFGCDICQEVCPWNRFSKPHQEPAFLPIPDLEGLSATEWEQMTGETFFRLFGKSPLKRTGYNGLKRNIVFVKK